MYLSGLHQGIIPPKIRPFPKFRVLLFLKKTSRFQNFSGTNLTQETRCFQNFSGTDYFGKLQVFCTFLIPGFQKTSSFPNKKTTENIRFSVLEKFRKLQVFCTFLFPDFRKVPHSRPRKLQKTSGFLFRISSENLMFSVNIFNFLATEN